MYHIMYIILYTMIPVLNCNNKRNKLITYTLHIQAVNNNLKHNR